MTTPPLADTLAQLDRWYAKHVPAIYATLRPGATDAELDALEQHIGFKLPQDFRELYKWHDGQNWNNVFIFGLYFIPLDKVQSEWDVWKELEPDFGDDEFEEHHSHPKGAITERYINTGWLAFLVDGGGNSLGIDLQPDIKGKVGQVINFGRDEENKYVLTDSLGDFLREYWQRLATGKVVILKPDAATYSVVLPDAKGFYPANGGWYNNADIYPGFGASPAIRAR